MLCGRSGPALRRSAGPRREVLWRAFAAIGFPDVGGGERRHVFKLEVSRHKSIDMLGTYVRSANAFVDHAGAKFL